MKELVIFDVDNTIVKGQSQGLLVNFLYKNKHVSIFYYLKLIIWVVLYKLGITKDPLSSMKYGLSFIIGKTSSEIEAVIGQFFKEVLLKNIYQDAINIIEEHRKNGRTIILVSNAPDVLINKLANYLKIENYLSTKLENVNGVYTGNILGEIMYGKQKLLAVRNYAELKGLSLTNSWAYGDHESDLFLLSNVAHPYVVNPSSSLRKIAVHNNWPTLTFKL